MKLCFDEFELCPRERVLLRRGREEALGGRAFDLLLALVEGRGRVVANAELIERVWPGTAVEPNNLQVQVWTLRRLLGRQAIATVARRGYRFTLPVAVWSGVATRGHRLPWPGLVGEACAALAGRHDWVTLLLAPGQSPEPLRPQAQSLAHGLGRTFWSLDACHLLPTTQAPAWLHKLGQGQVLLWLENAAQASIPALALLRSQRPGSVHVLAAAPAPLGVPGEQVCAAADPVHPAEGPACRPPAAASALRWNARTGRSTARPG
ncbi:DNA-binding protein with winged-HTH domain [Burkholderiales bacterium JOSHI_001]|nr:DNA-binding protein with winged-HTH domain [Burkholderiales bacterium JOSHI_001]